MPDPSGDLTSYAEIAEVLGYLPVLTRGGAARPPVVPARCGPGVGSVVRDGEPGRGWGGLRSVYGDRDLALADRAGRTGEWADRCLI